MDMSVPSEKLLIPSWAIRFFYFSGMAPNSPKYRAFLFILVLLCLPICDVLAQVTSGEKFAEAIVESSMVSVAFCVFLIFLYYSRVVFPSHMELYLEVLRKEATGKFDRVTQATKVGWRWSTSRVDIQMDTPRHESKIIHTFEGFSSRGARYISTGYLWIMIFTEAAVIIDWVSLSPPKRALPFVILTCVLMICMLALGAALVTGWSYGMMRITERVHRLHNLSLDYPLELLKAHARVEALVDELSDALSSYAWWPLFLLLLGGFSFLGTFVIGGRSLLLMFAGSVFGLVFFLMMPAAMLTEKVRKTVDFIHKRATFERARMMHDQERDAALACVCDRMQKVSGFGFRLGGSVITWTALLHSMQLFTYLLVFLLRFGGVF